MRDPAVCGLDHDGDAANTWDAIKKEVPALA